MVTFVGHVFFQTKYMGCVEGVVFDKLSLVGRVRSICANDRQTLVDVIIDRMWSIHIIYR